jgi:hypothetical protein
MWDRGMVASEAEGRAEALRRIAACRTTQAEELDLGGLQLTTLDGELLAALCQLGWLRRLFLGLSAEARDYRGDVQVEPHIAHICELLREPPALENSKVFKFNALGALPGALFDALPRLERLDLAFNRLRGLPASIANLTSLTSLDLAGNLIGAEASSSSPASACGPTALGTRARRRSGALSTSPASTWSAPASGTRGRRRSRA